MASQGLSRKRPAPGTSPPAYQQQMQPMANGYATGFGPQLSDEEFLRWGQNAQQQSDFSEAAAYDSGTSNLGTNNTLQPANQLARRPVNQLVNRARPHDDSNSVQWMSSSAATAQPLDGALADDVDKLEQKAQVAKQEAVAKRKGIPPFVQKLWTFVNEADYDESIRWSNDGNSFIVLDEDEFAKTLIPEMFKHNNYASFVRQLNMYGFHKKVGLSDNSMRASERKNKSPSEYSNPYFRRDHPDLLWLISKPKATTGQAGKGKGKPKVDGDQADDDVEEYIEEISLVQDSRPKYRPQLAIGQGDATMPQEQLAAVHRELALIRNQQGQISRMIASLKHEHQQLYGQAATFQDQHARHENSINAILTFLHTVYKRTIQGQPEAAPSISDLFAAPLPHEASQGNVLDVGDYSFDHMGPDGPMPRPFKRQPLLLKAPPSESPSGRASTGSPASTSSPYMGRQTRRMSQALHPGNLGRSGNVEEVFESNHGTPIPLVPSESPSNPPQPAQGDIMSIIQHSNARHSLSGTPAPDFSNVLTSLENSGGNTPLTSSQRADMLRLINSSSQVAGSSSSSHNNNNALVSPPAPSPPSSYNRRLASTTAELDSLVRMQAEQDRSVQNLTNLLQPLSPTGSIPGIGDGTSIPPAPPLDVDDFLNQSEYFGGFGSEGDGTFTFGDGTLNGDSNGIDFNNLPAVDNGDDELFSNINTANGQAQDYDARFRSDQNATAEDYEEGEDGGGRVESVASSSEVTTPQSWIDTTSHQNELVSRGKGRRMSITAHAGDGGKSPAKRRKRNG